MLIEKLKSKCFLVWEFLPLLILLVDFEFQFYFSIIFLLLLSVLYLFFFEKTRNIPFLKLEDLIGVVVFLCTPVVDFSFFWFLFGLILYGIFKHLEVLSRLKFGNLKLNTIIIYILSGLMTNFFLNLFYMAWKIIPLLAEYYKLPT